MKKDLIQRAELKLVGLTVRTNNKNEMNPEVAKIGALSGQYWTQNLADQISHRVHPGVTFCVYTEYDSDEHGDYTYFIGEEVSEFDKVPAGMRAITVPASSYQKFTTPEGKMPQVLISAWMEIWKTDFQNQRTYQADFEIYDHRAKDRDHTSLDICIGVKSV